MRFIQACAVAAAIGTVDALKLVQPRGDAKVVQHDIRRKQITDPVGRDKLRKRAKTVSSSLQNEETLYFMSVSIGTPAQNLNLHLDTGSSDLWVNVPTSTQCRGSNTCSLSGTYSPNKSSTYNYVNSLFSITYADSTGSSGDYATDKVSFGGATLSNQEFGIGYMSTSPEGILGIGYQLDEAIIAYDYGRTYTNVPANLVQSGYINSNAYSLWLNDLDASTGSILFGGVDTDKYHGTLETLPIVKENGLYSEFIVALTAIGYNGNTGSIANNQAIGALLDSGTSLTYLPNSIAQTIFATLGARYSSTDEAAIIDCSQASNTSTLDFTFSGVTIRVSMNELVFVAGYSNQGRTPICILGIGLSEGGTTVLGDTFLRSAYVVYDLANNQISLAQTDFNSSSTNIVEITSSTVPSASAVVSPVTQVTAEATGGRLNGGGGISISLSTAAAAPTAVYHPAIMGAVGAIGAGMMAVL